MSVFAADGSDSYGAETIEDEDKPQFTVAECPIDGWRGPRRGRPDTAQDDADRHNKREHPNVRVPALNTPIGRIGMPPGLPKIPSRTVAYDMVDVIERVRAGKIIVSPPFQRAAVWSDDQRRALIASWVTGLPIPALIINSRIRGGWKITPETGQAAVIDGKQRIETALAWLDDKLAIPAPWLPPEDIESVKNDYTVSFSNLSQRGRSMPLPIPMVETTVGSIEQEAALYLMVNSAGTPQTIKDLANARQVADAH